LFIMLIHFKEEALLGGLLGDTEEEEETFI
jgi:hypothetical protein